MSDRVEAIRKQLEQAGAEAFICYSYSNYRYLSRFTGSLAVVIISRDRLTIMSDFRYRTQIQDEVDGFDYVEIKGPPEEAVLAEIQKQRITKLAFESAHLTYRNYAHLKGIDSLELIPTENWVEDLRAVKDDSEMKLLRQAASIADAAIEKIAEELRPGMTESEAANRINALIRSLGAKKEAFDLIVASGPRSAMPHAGASDRRIRPGEPVVIDIGAQYEGYNSDLTRTVWFDKIDPARIPEVYDIVENAQAAAMRAIRPGLSCVDVDAVARDLIGEAGYGDYFGHGLGHGVGLDVHESPVISRLGKGSVRPGMVFTVEPGIYIPGVGGVRIEDMVVVTEDGCRRLISSAHSPEL